VDAAAFARDGIAGRVERLVSDIRHADERRFRGRQNRVVLTPRRWRQVSRSLSRPDRAVTKTYPRGDGGKRARSPGRARHKPLKPSACGNAGRFRCTRLLVRYLSIQSAHEAAGAAGTRHSPRPLLGRRIHAKLGRAASRDREVVGDEYERATLPAVIVCHRSARRAARREAPAGEPVFRGVSDGAGKPRRTGYPACAGYDGFWRTTRRPHGMTGISRDQVARIIDPATVFPIY
jgi:hypothetical protein